MPAKKLTEVEQLAAARRALESVRFAWRLRPGVLDVGLGPETKAGVATGNLALTVFVADKAPEAELADEHILPEAVFGIPVDVVEVRPPVRSGLFIEPQSSPGAYGTLGMVVSRNGDPADYFLTVAHLANPGSPIVVDPNSGPGWGSAAIGDAPTDPTLRVFDLAGDYMLVRARPGVSVVPGVYGLPSDAYLTRQAQTGMPVFRVHPRTGQRINGTVILDIANDIFFPDGTAVSGAMQIGPRSPATGRFSDPGDSGAMVFWDNGGAPPTLVGQVFALYPPDGNGQEDSAGCHIQGIKDAFGLVL